MLLSEKLAALENTVKEADDALLATIERLQADLDAAYKQADEMLKIDIDALRAEPETLKSQIAQQDEINDTVIQTLKSVDNTQQDKTANILCITIMTVNLKSITESLSLKSLLRI